MANDTVDLVSLGPKSYSRPILLMSNQPMTYESLKEAIRQEFEDILEPEQNFFTEEVWLERDGGVYWYSSLCYYYIPDYRGPQARGGVRSVETEPRCVLTDLYHGAMDYVTIDYLSILSMTWPWQRTMRPSNYSVGHKRLERVPNSNKSNHRCRVLSIESNAGYRWPLADSVFYPILLHHPWHSEPQYYRRCVME